MAPRRLSLTTSILLLLSLSSPPMFGRSRGGVGGPSETIHALVESGDVASIRDLLDKTPALVNALDPEGGTVLMHASYLGLPEVVRLLLDHGADVRAVDRRRITALHFAVQSTSVPVIALLLAHGAAVDAEAVRGWTPLGLAADQGSPEALSLLLERGANPNGGDPKWSPLRLVARHGLRQIVEKMISAGARVDARDYNNETALFWVARGGVTLREETVMAHLEGMKAPSYSSNGDFAGITELLIVRGSDVNALNKFRETPLHAAAKAGRTDVAEVLLRHAASLNARDRFGATPLWWAAEWGQAAYAKLLLDRGAEVDTPDEKGWTPLYCAARRGKADVTSVLIQHGADVNWKAAGGGFGLLREDFYTPLEAAATSGSAESVALLLKAGADPNIPKKHGRTALQCAIETSHMAIADTLRAHGARR